MNKLKECERCGGSLILCPADYPFNPEFWICEACDSTYCVNEEHGNDQ